MREALAEARAAFVADEVPVGCVFVDEETQRVLARGHNRTNETADGTRHAELVAIDTCVRPSAFPRSVPSVC